VVRGLGAAMVLVVAAMTGLGFRVVGFR
jgi:hypothetical protein